MDYPKGKPTREERLEKLKAATSEVDQEIFYLRSVYSWLQYQLEVTSKSLEETQKKRAQIVEDSYDSFNTIEEVGS